MNFLRKFWRNKEGATAIEYGLIAALIVVAFIVAVGSLGDNHNTNSAPRAASSPSH